MKIRIRAISYRISSHADTRYEIAAAREFANRRGQFRLEQGRLTIWPTEEFDNVEAAEKAFAPYLRAWEIQADLDYGPDSLRFDFESAEAEDLQEIEDTATTTRTAQLHSSFRVSDQVHAHVTRTRYPSEPQSFAVSEYVELAHRRWRGHLAGKEPLPSMAYFIYTIFHELGESNKGSAANFQIDKAVLRKLSELSTNSGDADAARKFQAKLPLTRMPDKERAWLEAAVPLLIRRLGEHTAAADLERITMASLPPLP